MQKIGVIGAGAWGTALAIATKRAGRDVTIWAHEAEVVNAINDAHENTVFLPGIKLDPTIKASTNIADALNADAVLMVAPAQHVRSVCEMAKPHWKKATPIVLCSKGVEKNSLNLMSEVAEQVLGDAAPIAVLSGPTFAKEVANNLPTAITLACSDEGLGQKLIDA
ncbi:MAG: NAD(P)-binding domain-containing protein, partial [Rhodospirillaceae bacterium]|nr:NAD(P)-binding domain-containing protein [Rhodospirillaceae bacterium]